MNIQNSSYLKSKSKSQWLFFIMYTIIIFATEPFYRKYLFDVSIPYIEALQGVDPAKNKLLLIPKFISSLGNTVAFMAIILVVYNIANIYKTYVLLTTIFLSTMNIAILKMIYVSPRPYWVSEKILSLDCEAGWGNPSGHSIASTAFYLTLWHILSDCNQLRDRKAVKNWGLVFTIFLIFSIMISRNFAGAHSINQILFGALIGFGIYFFLFYVLCIKVNDSKQLAQLLEFRNLIYVVINFFIFLFAFFVFYFNNNEDVLKWSGIIRDVLKIHGCERVPENKTLQSEGFLTFAVFLTNLGAFIGLKFEYYFTFNENLQNWTQYNFEIDERPDDESLMTKISINKETQWNHTNTFFSTLRFFMILILGGIVMTPYYLVDWNANITIVFIFKVFLPINMATFSMFFLFKIILKSLRLTNLTLYSMLQDSL
jgi:membrane-associated phospholipid phosphatase